MKTLIAFLLIGLSASAGVINPPSGGSGGSATNVWPLTSDANLGGYALTNGSSITVTGPVTAGSFVGTGSSSISSMTATNVYITVTNGLVGTDANGRMQGVTNATIAGVMTAQGFESPTNTWAINGPFFLGTNGVFTGGAQTGGITGIGNQSTSTERYGQLTIIPSGDITFTNIGSIRTSDMLSSRVLTNGNVVVIAVDLIPGRCTNMAIVQFK